MRETNPIAGSLPRYNRRSMRLLGYDYSQVGAYFLTICARNRQCLFGEVVDGEIIVNKLGDTIRSVWERLRNRFPAIELDTFIVMPDIVRVFQSLSAIACNRLLSRTGRPLWQRNYYEHVIRDGESLAHIRQYILDNPAGWAWDYENPANARREKPAPHQGAASGAPTANAGLG